MRTSPPAGLDREQVALRPRHPQHVAEGAEDHLGTRRDLQRLVDHLQRGDADRAARSVDEVHLVGEQLIDSELDDGVGLTAAHLHQRPGPPYGGEDRLGKPACGLRVPVLVDVAHSPHVSVSECLTIGELAASCPGAEPRPDRRPSVATQILLSAAAGSPRLPYHSPRGWGSRSTAQRFREFVPDDRGSVSSSARGDVSIPKETTNGET